MLNNPKKVPSPDSRVLSEALNLIAGLGSGDKNLKSMLEEMKEVQKHNEKVVQDAIASCTESNKILNMVKKERDSLHAEKVDSEKKIQKITEANNMERYELEKQKTDFHERMRVRENTYNENVQNLILGQTQLKNDQGNCDSMKGQYESMLEDVRNREAAISYTEQNLSLIKEYIEGHL